ncbi:Asp23/Gls24 family envelope stress response protein [Streptomyces sp. NPDC048441]|uniref:Asp23/Gls24 family envelope stress response protein n=1 Tax=Streptomyces sp. NPDC048441 TaxID=3365552 RepID=UPI003717BA3B
MAEQRTPRALADAVRVAVLRTPGVAFMRPGLAELLRSSLPLRSARAAGTARDPSESPSGVRVYRARGTEEWTVEVEIVLFRSHRALDVGRQVRAVAADAFQRETGRQNPPEVVVTVTGRV